MNYITKHCLFCKDQENLKELYPRTFTEKDLTAEVFSARRSADQLHYKIVRCANCGLIFSQDILPPEELEKLYSQSTVTYGKYADIIRQDYWRGLKPYLSQVNKGAALEIGCGNGFFLEELLGQGFEQVSGCEPSTAAIAQAKPEIKDQITSGVFKAGLYQENTFDLVCSFQTLDHMPAPLETVRICQKILKPNGIAYFVTHNTESLQAKLLKERSPIIDVEHIYLFNKQTLRRLFETENFQVLNVANLKNSYPISYWFELLSLNKLAQLMNKVGLGLIRLPLAAGNIAIIAKNQK